MEDDRLIPYEEAVEQFLISAKRLIPRRADVRVAHGALLAEDIEDEQTGEQLIPAWTVLRALHIGIIVAAGRTTVSVIPSPRVALLGIDTPPATVPAVRTMCERARAIVVAEHACDADPRAISEWLNGVAQISDVIVTCGGESAVAEVLHAEGRLQTSRVATDPELHVALGRIAQRPVICAPGEPALALLHAHVFLQRVLRAMAGLPAEPAVAQAQMDDPPSPTPGSTTLIPVRIEHGRATLAASLFADGFAVIDERGGVVVELLT